MVVKLLGVADLLSAIAVVLLHYQLLAWKIGLVFVCYLLIKGWLFRQDINSVMDILCGIYVFVILFGFTTFVSWIVTIYLFQKAVFSLV